MVLECFSKNRSLDFGRTAYDPKTQPYIVGCGQPYIVGCGVMRRISVGTDNSTQVWTCDRDCHAIFAK